MELSDHEEYEALPITDPSYERQIFLAWYWWMLTVVIVFIGALYLIWG